MTRATLLVLIFAISTTFATAADFATQVAEATFKLGKGSSGTCFLVRREAPDTALYLVTAGHAFDENSADKIVIVLRQPTQAGGLERCEFDLKLRADGKPLWVRHEKYDVAVLRIIEKLPTQVPALIVTALADADRLKAASLHVCSSLFVFGYPMGLEADSSGLPVARQGIFANSPMQPQATHPSFLADYNGFQGDSGGPVFIQGADNQPLVVGIVTDQHYYDDDLNGTYQQTKIRNPLGVVKILHAHYVLETLDAAARQAGAGGR